MLFSSYFALRTLHAFSPHLILIATPQNRSFYYPHFRDEEPKTWRDQVTRPTFYSQQVADFGFGLRQSDSKPSKFSEAPGCTGLSSVFQLQPSNTNGLSTSPGSRMLWLSGHAPATHPAPQSSSPRCKEALSS